MISIIVTVGPHKAYKKYLRECLNSITDQKHSLGEYNVELVVVDDAAHLPSEFWWNNFTLDFTNITHGTSRRKINGWKIVYVKNAWNLGQASSINTGIALARHDTIFVMGGSDDLLLSGCLEACYNTWQEQRDKYCCVHPIIETSRGDTSTLPQGVWMFSRSKVWAALGGYPPEAGVGEVDAIFCSMMLKQGVKMIQAGSDPLYWHREHPDALGETKSSLRHEIAGMVRGLCTQEWKKPEWIEGYGYE